MESCRDRSNFDEIELTEHEINNLPSRFRSYAKENSGQFQNELISVSPPYIKFPYDDLRYHECKVTIWNKTNKFLELDVDFPCSGVFKVSYARPRAGNLYGGTAATLKVSCIAKEIQLCTDFIRIRVKGKNIKPLTIPLELYPSASWFILPRIIFVPSVSVGKQIETQINLPRPHSEGRYYFIIKVLTEMDCFTVSPANGYLNSFNSREDARKIVIKYTPTEYTSLVYTFHIIFPEMPEFHPYEVNVHTRCIPNSEANAIRAVTKQMECLILKSPRIKAAEPRIKFPKNENNTSEPEENLNEDIFSHAGIMHFMLKKGGQLYESRKNIGPLGLTSQQQHHIYREKEREFRQRLKQIQIHEKNMALQNSRPHPGQESILENIQELERLKKERDEQFHEYYTALGLHDNDPNDLTRRKMVASNQRSIRDDHQNYSMNPPEIDDEEIIRETEKNKRWAQGAAQRRFVQAARLIITRKRAAKRIVKLRLLINELRSGSKKGEKRVEIQEIGQPRSNRAMTLPGVSKKDKRTASIKNTSATSMHKKSIKNKDSRSNPDLKANQELKPTLASTNEMEEVDDSEEEEYEESADELNEVKVDQ